MGGLRCFWNGAGVNQVHSRFYNEAIFEVRLHPRTPLLIKAGGEGAAATDPTVPDMSFVRTRRPGGGEVLYIPGSSLRGVLRAHAERLLRSVEPDAACDPLVHGSDGRGYGLRRACSFDDRIPGDEAYRKACRACRLFGTTGLASRVRVSDFYPDEEPVCDTRYGVAIDRVTGAVAHGPFELEIVTDGSFVGTITLRNFTLGQFGLVAAALLDVGDGLVPLGFGKSRDLGRVDLTVTRLVVRTLRDPEGALAGAGALCDDRTREAFRLPAAERERLSVGAVARREKGFFVLVAEGAEARRWLEEAVPRWLEEMA